ncbi:MAG TPA: DUF4188 domain-containing protein [Caulobacteraceae bacterium]|nr:DUF4188 domain-containing protein [Caulobacteraceae bacterium]
MTQRIDRRVCAEVEGAFVVFMIGARINRWWKPWIYFPFLATMPAMLGELAANPDLGLMHVEQAFSLRSLTLIQYWRSFEQLEAYARDRQRKHQPVWAWFNKRFGSNGDIGIWHETYLIQPGCYESIYNNMPPYGLGGAGTLVDAVGARQEARLRMKAAVAEAA